MSASMGALIFVVAVGFYFTIITISDSAKKLLAAQERDASEARDILVEIRQAARIYIREARQRDEASPPPQPRWLTEIEADNEATAQHGGKPMRELRD